MEAEATAEIHRTLNSFLHAVESMDLDRIAAFFEEDAQMFSPMPAYAKRLDGRSAILEQFGSIINFIKSQNLPGGLKLEVEDVVVRDFGPVALVTFHLRQPGPVHRRSFVMRRGPAGWRIAHIHASIASAAESMVAPARATRD
jgi:ketosteroid isomerase-like protein